VIVVRGTTRSLLGVFLGAIGFLCPLDAEALNPERLEPHEIALLESTLSRLQPLIDTKKRDGTANLLTWEELLSPLSEEEHRLTDAFRALRADALGATSHYFGAAQIPPDLVPVGLQQIRKDDAITVLDPQHLPREAFEAYTAMMAAMSQELGKRLLVESGYRSPAYQLYLFLFYLPKHGYSIRETNRHVALPGYSEHGNPARQAVDFINEDGINGEDHPEEFEGLPEYQWLQQHAEQFGFFLSYPRDNPYHTAFEPWHWHFEPP